MTKEPVGSRPQRAIHRYRHRSLQTYHKLLQNMISMS